ncbi:MAG TPA: c-type cytochrome domain-containing protein, partial [Pirellulales bacterium]|nr:c-type cytochrome domain-containing protein [Pirellulales bacterium]
MKLSRTLLTTACLITLGASVAWSADVPAKESAGKDSAAKDPGAKGAVAKKAARKAPAGNKAAAGNKAPVSNEPSAAKAKPVQADPLRAVSYWQQVRPILQANCNGCHQPAKAGGKLVMTSFEKLLAGGESGEAAIKPGQPAASYLIEQITPHEGKADMPKEKPPLSAADIATLTRWISQGAKDDSAAFAGPRYDMDHPPQYPRPAVITSIDYSPDGKLLAVAAFHEVLLVDGESSKLVARLVGQSERIESVRFSPDGGRLAVTGGLPSRMGEVQIWDVPGHKQLLSVPATFNSVYGASWSPDGKLLAFGCGDIDDNTVRAINAETGEQVLYQGAHSDWVRETAFSVDGKHVVSVARDMTVKLTEVATQRFIDNVTSITPGVLKGGIQSVARHPKFDILVAGGSDGTPKIYRIFRESKRVIGDDANLVMDLFPMTGRVFSVRFSADGKKIVAASSLNGAGEIVVCSFDYDADVPISVKAVMAKVPKTRTPAEEALLAKYRESGVKLLARVPVSGSAIYTVAFHPSGKLVAAAGADGLVRLIDVEQGKLVKEFQPAPLTAAAADKALASSAPLVRTIDPVSSESLPAGTKLVGLEVQPEKIELDSCFDYVQLLVTGRLDNGETTDVTRMVRSRVSRPLIDVAANGLVQPRGEGKAVLVLTAGGQSVRVPVSVSGMSSPLPLEFAHDVAPMLSKLGCNAGTCHGSAQGKNGFKLSLRGYDPLYDVRTLTDDLASRRVNLVSPDDSLMLLKASAGAPHMGGQLTRQGEAAYEMLRNWIQNGARLDTAAPRVARITISPQNPVVPRAGGRQQMRVLATYADGQIRDV